MQTGTKLISIKSVWLQNDTGKTEISLSKLVTTITNY